MLEHCTQLFRQNPDVYRRDLASIQNSLGNLYKDLHDFTKAEGYYLKALENKTQLFNQNPDAYRTTLASSQRNFMLLYEKMENGEKFDEMLEQALKNYEILAQKDSRYQENMDKLRKWKQQRAAIKEQ